MPQRLKSDLQNSFDQGKSQDKEIRRASLSMHRTERQPQLSQELEAESKRSTLSLFAAGIIGKMRSFKENISKLSANHEAVRARFEQWDNQAYLDLLKDERYQTPEKIRSLLYQNFVAFADEYTRGELVTSYSFEVIPEIGLFGMDNSYEDPVDAYGEGFAQKLKRQGKQTSRAQIERENLNKLNAWALQAANNSLLIWNSPPGSNDEGYGGLDGHSFIFVYHKISETRVEMKQYRNWASLNEHALFQQTLSRLNGDTHLERKKSAHEIIANTIALDPKDFLPGNSQIGEVVGEDVNETRTNETRIWANEMMAEIVSLIQNTHEYQTKASELPQLDEDAFKTHRDLLFEIYFETALPLLIESQTLAPDNHRRKKEILKTLDTAFGILAYQPLASWVEKASDQSTASKPGLLPIEPLAYTRTLKQMYQIQLKQEFGQKITKTEKAMFSLSAPSLLQISNQAMSMGQCGIGSFFSPRLASSLTSSFGNSVGSVSSIPVLSGLSQESFLRRGYKPLTLSNGQSFMVPTEHFSAYLSGSYIGPDGIAYGPCGVPLYADSLVYAFLKNSGVQKKSSTQNPFIKFAKDMQEELNFKHSITPIELINDDLYV